MGCTRVHECDETGEPRRVRTVSEVEATFQCQSSDGSQTMGQRDALRSHAFGDFIHSQAQGQTVRPESGSSMEEGTQTVTDQVERSSIIGNAHFCESPSERIQGIAWMVMRNALEANASTGNRSGDADLPPGSVGCHQADSSPRNGILDGQY